MISGIVTGILLASFIGIAAWAWSSRQRARFDDAARLPFDEPAGAGRTAVPHEGDDAEGRP